MNFSNKQLYSSKLLFQNPSIYETFKRMTKNKKNYLSNQTTSQTTIKTINKSKDKDNINNSEISKNNSINNNSNNIIKHLSYTKFLKSRGIPFGTVEKRFKWQNLQNTNYPTGMNTFKNVSKHFKNKYNIPQVELKFKSSKKNNPLPWNDISLNKTKRVLLTNIGNDNDFNDYILKTHKKYFKNENYKIFNNVINLKNMFLKSPLKYNYRGIKIVKRNNSSDLNLFRKDYARNELPRVRKHFAHIDHINDIMHFKNNKSMDDINYIKEKKEENNKGYVNIYQSYSFRRY